MAVAYSLVAPRSMSFAATHVTVSAQRRRLGLGLFMLVALLGACYLWQTNAVATKGYEIKALNRKLTTLRQTNQRLEVQSAELQAKKTEVQSVAQADFVAVEHIEYLSVLPTGSVGLAVR